MRVEALVHTPPSVRAALRQIPPPALSDPDDTVSLQLIIPTSADMQIDADPALWTASGRCTARGPVTEVDLGQGRIRREYPDGRVTLDGTKRLGQPVHRVRRPTGEESWQIDYPAVWATMHQDLQGVDRPGPSSVETLQHGRAVHFAAGPLGNQFTRLEVSGRGAFNVVSDGPLSAGLLENMATAIAGAPKAAFADVKLLFVMGELGATQDASGRLVGTVAGFAQYESRCLFFTRERLDTEAGAKDTMWHEAGHLFDRAHHASDTLADEQSVPLFGYGKLVMEGNRVAVDESDFITRYASTNEQEDFAENHRAALQLRDSWSASHAGADLFSLTPSQVEGEMAGYSPSIRRRMGAIVRIYQEERPAAEQG